MKVITAEEFCKKRNILLIDDDTKTYTINASIKDFLDFTKLHVKSALEAAANTVRIDGLARKEFILKSYPEENIK